MKINLSDLLTKPKSELPDWVDKFGCIYKITRISDGYSYIGQCRWLYGRFVSGGYNHKSQIYLSNSELYSSIRSEGLYGFDVQILEYDIPRDLLNEREVFWISHYNTYVNGFNKTPGGGYTRVSRITEEGRRRAIESIKSRYGDSLSQLNNPEVQSRAKSTNIKRYGSPFGKLHSPESLESQKNNHGGKLACHTPEAVSSMISTQRSMHDGLLAFHTEYSYLNRIVNLIFKKLLEYNDDHVLYFNKSSRKHINTIISKHDKLMLHPRWSDALESLYNDILKMI